ncbi:alpha/beta-hydrolase [Hymenopellis radicata]|nr:alpha/beta-hydrolase [Hymenopellis radicata]
MSMISGFLALLFASTVLANGDGRVAQCVTKDFVISLNVTTLDIPIPVPSSQEELTGTIVPALAPTAPQASFENRQLVANYSIATLICSPPNFDGGVVNFALHGLGFTKSYWDVVIGDNYTYSFAEAAAARGEATFAYDRLGTGGSIRADGTYPDGIQELQLATHIAVANAMAQVARDELQPKNLVAVGHSYGSFTLLYLASAFPQAIDHLVLTGFSADPESYSGGSAFALNLALANEAYPDKFAALDNTYLATGDLVADLTIFFSYPHYGADALQWSIENRGTIAYGELLTFGPPAILASDFTGSVLAINGDADFDCNKEAAPVQHVEDFFPNAQNFSASIVEGAGHGQNVHFSAAKMYEVIGEWIQDNVVSS